MHILAPFFPTVRFFLGIALSVQIAFFQPPEPPDQASPGLIPPQAITSQTNSPQFTGCTAQVVSGVSAAYEQEVVELVNAERTAKGLPPLKRVPHLDDAARYHATDMVQDKYFQHDSYDRVNNQLKFACRWSDRVAGFYENWSNLGENLAQGYASPADAMAGWMSSQGHRDNILNPSFTEIGVGYATGAYWSQDFGKRSDSYPVIINNEADTTASREVTLYVYGSWGEIRLRNNQDAWAGWQPFRNTLPWQLPNQSGLHTVSAELRSGSTVVSSSDQIELIGISNQAQLGNLPDTLHFTYSIADQRLSPSQIAVTPINTGNQTVLSWALSVEGNWFTATPAEGRTPGAFTVTPAAFDPGSPNSYSGSITVAVTSPAGTAGSPHRITLVLDVVEKPVRMIYMPILTNRR
jgi:uncharacterized protein YkwD